MNIRIAKHFVSLSAVLLATLLIVSPASGQLGGFGGMGGASGGGGAPGGAGGGPEITEDNPICISPPLESDPNATPCAVVIDVINGEAIECCDCGGANPEAENCTGTNAPPTPGGPGVPPPPSCSLDVVAGGVESGGST